MSNHKLACCILIGFIVAMFYGTQKMRTRAVSAREAAEETKNQAEMAEQQRRVAEIKLKTIDSKTTELRSVYHEWLPHFEAVQDPQAGEQRISELVREGDIFLLSQKYEERELDTDELISHAIVAILVIEDDYTKTMNWLGTLEEKIPACRISNCKITRGDRGNNIHVELTVHVPVLKSA